MLGWYGGFAMHLEVELKDYALDIQTPIEEVFEPPNISWEGF